ncbi:MAG TPA: hypothetical protein V6D16_20515, partial [Candidatus Obscuribacterales bacterium]
IQVYLVDFGSVRAATVEENTNFTVVGTYGYMPPEQFSGRAIAASDLYSLGATLITLVTGTHPSSLPRRGSRIDFSQVADLSPAFADWLSWMTESSLERRLASAQAALQALEQGQTRNAAAAVVTQPADSKVTLNKNASSWEATIPALFGQIRLRIDAQEITLAQKRLGLAKGRPQVGRRQEIRNVTYTKSGDTPKLVIAVGSQQYELGEPQSLTVAELDWLAYELSSWLKVPLTKA